ncbi:MAG: TonB-dependent receptor [Thiobacillaceae bacterium]|nr:TonB-dependent receptor [Thiobacillaceae bacterium]
MKKTSTATHLGCLLGLLDVASAEAGEVTLAPISVTAKGYAADRLETPFAEATLTPPAHAGGVPGDLFSGGPGLAAHGDGAWGRNPVLRGLKKESIVLMVDGLRVNSAQPVGAIASLVDVDLLERAEVVKGPTSVLYGSGALGGVVNLITPAPQFAERPTWSGAFRAGGASADDSLAGALRAQYAGVGHALVLGVAAAEVDDYDSPRGRVARSGYSADALLLRTRHRLAPDVTLSLNLQRHASHDVWYPGSARTGGQPGGAGIPPVLGTVTLRSPEQRRTLYALGAQTRAAGEQLAGEVYRQEVYRQIRAYSSTLQRDYVRNRVTFATDGARLAWTGAASEGHLLTLGTEYWRMTADPERYSDTNAPLFNNNQRTDPFSDGVIRAAGVFVQDEFALGATRVLLGARYDAVQGRAAQKGMGAGAQTTGLKRTDGTLSWSIGAIHAAQPLFNPYVNLGQAYRAADMRERFEDSARGDGYYHMGNPQLKPEFSTSLEVGAKGRSGAFEYQLAAFHTVIRDAIAGRITGANHPGTGLPIKRTENLDMVVIYGLEGQLSRPLGRLQMEAAFTWLRGDNEQDDEPAYQMPAPELRLGLMQPAARGLSWRLELRAVARQSRVARKFSNGMENPTPGYTVVNLGAGWGFGRVGAWSELALEAAVNNLFDRSYHDHLTEGLPGREIKAPGRSLALALRGRF